MLVGMRERRIKSGGRVVFDYKQLLDKRSHRGKKLIRMKRGPITYTTAIGTRFWKDHPFQLVKEDEAEFLLALPESHYAEFVEATIEQVEDYYAD
jgi:hypothetical protein